jgi:hypothetical protein
VFRLPVSGIVVRLRPTTGADELALLDAGSDTAAAVELARRLTADGPADWLSVTPTDLDAFVMQVRRAMIGEHVRTDVACPAAGCGQRIDIAFRVTDYLASRTPEPPADAAIPDKESGRFRLAEVVFRLVTVGDQLAVEGLADPAAALAQRCVQAEGPVADAVMRSIEAELERMAPNLAGPVSGRCPECGADVEALFDPRSYCLTELRGLARFVFRDVDAIARRYHWPEREVLELPSARRAIYAEFARRPNAAG